MTKDLYAEASAHLEVLGYQDEEASANTELPEDIDSESSDFHEVKVAGDRDDGNTHKTPDYDTTMDIDV